MQPKPIKSETMGMRPKNLCFNKFASYYDAHLSLKTPVQAHWEESCPYYSGINNGIFPGANQRCQHSYHNSQVFFPQETGFYFRSDNGNKLVKF